MRIAINKWKDDLWEASVGGPWYSDSDLDFEGKTREEVLEKALKFIKELRDDCNEQLREHRAEV